MKIILLKQSKEKNNKARKAWALSWPMIFSFLASLQLITLFCGYIFGQQNPTQQAKLNEVNEILVEASAIQNTELESEINTSQDLSSTINRNQPDFTSNSPEEQALNSKLEHLNLKVSKAEARLSRLDELAKALLNASGLVDEGFNFDAPPPLGGPHLTSEPILGYNTIKEAQQELKSLENSLQVVMTTLEKQANRFYVISDIIKNKHLHHSLNIDNSPVEHGWISSKYGFRKDPFTGRRAWHDGIDIASREGEPILSVSSGVVLRAGYVRGYGNLVEVSHPNGYVTRYAHCKKILVSSGQLIKEGQTVATVGSTGRSTGPHVHFEVLVEGKSVDPRRYLNQSKRKKA